MLIHPGLRSGEPGFQGKGKKRTERWRWGVKKKKENRLKADGGGEWRKAGEQTGFEVTEFKATAARDGWEERHTAAQQPSTFLCHTAPCSLDFSSHSYSVFFDFPSESVWSREQPDIYFWQVDRGKPHNCLHAEDDVTEVKHVATAETAAPVTAQVRFSAQNAPFT